MNTIPYTQTENFVRHFSAAILTFLLFAAHVECLKAKEEAQIDEPAYVIETVSVNNYADNFIDILAQMHADIILNELKNCKQIQIT